MKLRLFLIAIPLIIAQIGAQETKGPYEVFPPANPPYFRIRYEAGVKPQQLKFAVKYTIWIPPNVKTLRGIVVHQHGCGIGSCKSGLTGAYDLHWQALARKHDCALMAPSYEQPKDTDCQLWCDPRNGSGSRFQQALVDLGKKSDHLELSRIPWALWGHSGGGHWAGGMLMLHPEKVAAVWLRSGVPYLKESLDRPSIKPHKIPEAALTVPIMCNLGTKEGVTVKTGRFSRVWPANEVFFDTLSKKNGQIAYAVDPLTSHECGNQRYLAIPWFDSCLDLRLPRAPNTQLVKITSKNSGSFRHQIDGRNIWLPSPRIKKMWLAYIKNTAIPDQTPPPLPTDLRVNGTTLTWTATADLESGLAHFIIFRDDKPIATIPDEPLTRFGRPLFQGLQYSDTPQQPLSKMIFIDPQPTPGTQHKYRVIAVNTVGLKSQ
jgi:pimeloyl-ACP methyl ester carboxylesterase